MTVQHILIGVGVLYGGSEIVLALLLRSRDNVARGSDRGSLGILWTTITLAIFAAIQVAARHPGPVPGPAAAWVGAGLALLLAGLALRWTAILTLRGAFTVDVAIARDQHLVERGPYRRVRHPAPLRLRGRRRPAASSGRTASVSPGRRAQSRPHRSP